MGGLFSLLWEDGMKLWIDGDSCHRKAMEIALKAHGKKELQVVVVADREVPQVREQGAEMMIVPHGSGEADNLIAGNSNKGDLAVTRDFPLGIRLMKNGVTVMNDRGRIWSLRELESRAEEAELMKALRNGGIAGKSRRNYTPEDSHDFAASLDRIINSGL